ncbi:MAG: hypothetical protein H7138_17700 [Myxococcales bacterium]|nr:hypothetical protein [Myxococcales bacterium]
MNRFSGGVTLAAGLLGALGLVGCGSVNSPAVPDGPPMADGQVPPIDGGVIDGPSIDSMPTDGPPIDMQVIPAAPKFDFGFIDEFTIAWNFAGNGFSGFAAVANTSNKPLNLNKLTIVSVTDDDPMVTSVFALERASETPLAPANAAGQLAGQAIVRIIESGLMTEPLVDESLLFNLYFPNFNDTFINRVVHIKAKIQIDDGEIELPMTVRFVASQVTLVDHAARLSARAVPGSP